MVTEAGPDPSAAAVHPGITEQVSVDDGGNPVIDEEDFLDDSQSTDGAISADGSAVVFASQATLDPERDLNEGEWDVYLRQRDRRDVDGDDSRTILISRAYEASVEPGEPPWEATTAGSCSGEFCEIPDVESTNPSISADGRFVVFQSNASNLRPGPAPVDLYDDSVSEDVFVYDRDPDGDGVFDEHFDDGGSPDGDPTLMRMPSYHLTLDDLGTSDWDSEEDDREESDWAVRDGSLSADGRHVVFTAGYVGGSWQPGSETPAYQYGPLTTDPEAPRSLRARVRYDRVDVEWFTPEDTTPAPTGYRVRIVAPFDPTIPPIVVEATSAQLSAPDVALNGFGNRSVTVCALYPDIEGAVIEECAPSLALFVRPSPSYTIAVDRDPDGDGVFAPPEEWATDATPPVISATQLEIPLAVGGWVPAPLGEPEVSADGRWVAAVQGRVPVTGVTAIVVVDRDPDGDGAGFDDAAGLQVVSPAAADVDQEQPVVSSDGRVVAFARVEPDGEGSNSQVYGTDRGEPDAVGGYPAVPVTTLISSPDPAAPTVGGDGWSDEPDVSDDGRYVAFASGADDLPHVPDRCGEGGTCSDVFVHDRERPAEEVALASVDRSEPPGAEPALGGDDDSDSPALSIDGRSVSFDSRASTVRAAPLPDESFNRDVFVRDFRPRLEGTPNPTDFGAVPITTTADRTVTFTNVDWGPLPLRATDAVTNGDPHFTITASTCDGAVLHGGDSCEVDVRFAPTVEDTETDLLVAFGEDDTPLERVRLVGRGTPPPVGPVFRADPNPVDFGSLPVAGSVAVQDLTVSNDGDAPYTVDGTTLVGAAAAEITIVDDDCTGEEITPVETCVVRLAFDPAQAGLRTAAIRFDDTAPGAPHDVPIRGRGAVPVFQAVPDPVDFGAPLVGDPVDRLVTVTNVGDAPMEVSTTSLAGVDAADFAVVTDGCSTTTLGPAVLVPGARPAHGVGGHRAERCPPLRRRRRRLAPPGRPDQPAPDPGAAAEPRCRPPGGRGDGPRLRVAAPAPGDDHVGRQAR